MSLCAIEAKAGSEATAGMIARHDLMQILGSQALGHVDPGSMTIALLFSSMDEFLSLQVNSASASCMV
jgi:hypothetical protein